MQYLSHQVLSLCSAGFSTELKDSDQLPSEH
jgi:hypothetical protein